jgi:thymidylate synthase ThyX
MSRTESTQQIREAARGIAQQLMKIHPAVPGLDDADVQREIYVHLHTLTTELESIKKKLARLEARDASSDL